MDNVITVKGATKRFKEAVVLDNISVSFESQDRQRKNHAYEVHLRYRSPYFGGD